MNKQIEAVRNFLQNANNHLTHMADGDYRINTHNSDIDNHIVSHLPNVDQSHINTDPYNVVTVSKDITMDNGVVIPKIVQLEVNANNEIQNVLESK